MSTEEEQLVNIDQVANLLGRPPGWMLYWGTTLVTGVVVLLFLLAAMVQYPDEVVANVQLQTEPAPLRQFMPQDARMADLLFSAGESVDAGQVLAVLESTADWLDVQRLGAYLDSLSTLNGPVDALGLDWDEQLEIGDLRPTYARLISHLSELQYWLRRSSEGQRASNLQRQLQQNEIAAQQLAQQTQTAEAEYTLAQANYLRFDSLLRGGYASQLEVDQAQAQALQAKFRLEQQQGRQLDNSQGRERLVLETLSLGEQLSDQVAGQWLGFKRELRSLQYEYQSWREQHVLYARASGQMSPLMDLRLGQQVVAGTPLWGIVPNTDQALQWMAVGTVTDAALGKIEVGDTALIRLPAFPHREFGQLAARVTEISLLSQSEAQQPQYRVLLSLPQGLTTSYQRTIEARQSLSGQARILSEKRSMLARLFDNLWKVKERMAANRD